MSTRGGAADAPSRAFWLTGRKRRGYTHARRDGRVGRRRTTRNRVTHLGSWVRIPLSPPGPNAPEAHKPRRLRRSTLNGGPGHPRLRLPSRLEVTGLGPFADDPLLTFAWHAAHGSPLGRVVSGRLHGTLTRTRFHRGSTTTPGCNPAPPRLASAVPPQACSDLSRARSRERSRGAANPRSSALPSGHSPLSAPPPPHRSTRRSPWAAPARPWARSHSAASAPPDTQLRPHYAPQSAMSRSLRPP